MQAVAHNGFLYATVPDPPPPPPPPPPPSPFGYWSLAAGTETNVLVDVQVVITLSSGGHYLACGLEMCSSTLLNDFL